MKNKIIHILTFLICILAMQSFAQQAPKGWQLLGEGKGNEVRLLWTATQWNDTVQGMIIKRRVAGGAWTTLTSSPIYPLISPKKNLNNVSNDPAVVAYLKKKMADNPGDYAGMDSTSFVQMLAGRGGLAMFTFAMAKDYDRALVSGFAYYDKKISAAPGTKVEYGLFAKKFFGGESGPVATWQWTAGETPKYTLNAIPSVRGNKKNNTITVKWKIKTETYLNAKVLQGFNVDRIDNGQRTRVTKQTIWPNTAEETFNIFVNHDKVTDANKKYTYELIPLSVLGYESAPIVAVYDPTMVPSEFPISLTSSYKDGDTSMTFTIQVPAEAEKFVESYEVEEKTTIIKYKSVGVPVKGKKVTIPYDTSRTYPQPYEYRLKVNLKDGYDPLYSPDVKVDYNPKIIPARTSGAKAVLVQREGNYYAHLTWNKVSGAEGYYIFIKERNGDRMIWESSIPLITGQEYFYPFGFKGSASYTFAIGAVDKTRANIGALSDNVTVATPSQSLLRVWLKDYKQVEEKKVLVTWDYMEPGDLTGYRLYENGKLVADEKVLKKGTQQWKSAVKEPGKYEYTIEALTTNGMASERSFGRTVIVK